MTPGSSHQWFTGHGAAPGKGEYHDAPLGAESRLPTCLANI